MTREPSPTRREFLLTAGTAAALAGCGGRTPLTDDSPDRIRVTELPEVPDREDSEPVVANDLPVDIERERLRDAANRVTGLLETLPMPFGPEDVPNGYVRRKLVRAAERATDRLDEARSAPTRLAALESLHRARTDAGYAAAGWAFVDRSRTEADLRTERRETVADAEAFRSNYAYAGDDPVRAAVVHAYVRRTLQRVLDARVPHTSESSPLLTVADWGGHTESIRGYLVDGRHLYDRFTAGRSSDVGTVEPALRTAADALTAELRRRRDELPPEPDDPDRELAGRIAFRLRRHAESSARSIGDLGPARAVLTAMRGLVEFLALDRVRDWSDDEVRSGVETAADVRTARSEALEAIRAALAESPRPELSREVLSETAALVVSGDDELARYRTSVRPARLNDPVRRYLTATVRARSTPTACRRVLEAVDG